MKKTLATYSNRDRPGTCRQSPQTTNLVKVSQLPSANTLTGSEIVSNDAKRLDRQRDIESNIGTAEALMATGTNNIGLLVTAANTALNVVSNNANNFAATALVEVQGTNAANRAALTATNNTLLAAISATNAPIQAQIQATNAAAQAAIQATNTIVQNEMAALQAGGGPLTNGATASFASASINRLSTPSTNMPTLSETTSGNAQLNLDFSKGSFQTIAVGIFNATSGVFFNPINWRDGDNVWLEVICTNGISGNVGTVGSVTGGSIDSWNVNKNTGATLNGSVKTALLNWQVLGTNLILTEAVHP